MVELGDRLKEIEGTVSRQEILISNIITKVVDNTAQISKASTDANDCQVRLRGAENLQGYNPQSHRDVLSKLIGTHLNDIGCHQKAKTHFSIDLILPNLKGSKKTFAPIAILQFHNKNFRDAFERNFKEVKAQHSSPMMASRANLDLPENSVATDEEVKRDIIEYFEKTLDSQGYPNWKFNDEGRRGAMKGITL